MKLVLVTIGVAVGVLWYYESGKEGFEAPPAPRERIFVSIPSYRDDACMATVREAFAKAADPTRIFVGCCEQNTASEKERCRPVDFAHHTNVRVISIPHVEAMGPTYARALCASLYRGEEYVLSIDAHSSFAKGWDATLIRMIKTCPDPARSILTHYPPGLDDTGTTVPRLCKLRFGEHGLPVLDAVSVTRTSTPHRVPYMAGGMWFAPGRIMRDVPMDPTLDFLFQGEEFLLSARCWTSGYDMYTPTENVVYHDYKREHAPRYWNDLPEWHARQQATVARVRQMLSLGGAARQLHGPYGLGSVRTLEAYYQFARLDPVAQTSSGETAFC